MCTVQSTAPSNIILIGMPGAGKSTIGVLLAKVLGKHFVDTDLLIQQRTGRKLQDILDTQGYQVFRDIEERELLKLAVCDAVIATGGSAVYSDAAMRQLKAGGVVVYLDVALKTLTDRLQNWSARGIARTAAQSFQDLFAERTVLYRRYQDIHIVCGDKGHNHLVHEITLRMAQFCQSKPPGLRVSAGAVSSCIDPEACAG